MKRLINWFTAARSSKPSPRRRQSCQLEVETLETRLVPASLGTKTAVLDFGGVSLNQAELQSGGWTFPSSAQVSTFKDLFTANRPFLDFNLDGAVNDADANFAINQIVSKVKTDYAPYDLNIVVGSWSQYSGIITDSQVGDVMVFVTGHDGFTNKGGESPWTDLGNERDEIVWASGAMWVNGFGTDAAAGYKFINGVAEAISHEMGHAFGLGHISADPSGDADAIRHHIMNPMRTGAASRDADHDFNFQDHTYQIDIADTGTIEDSINHPELNNTNLQNAHQILSMPDVLGPSTHSWMAVLKPGELTVSGDDAANTILVKNGPGNVSWLVTIDGQLTPVDLNAQFTQTLNPFDQPLSQIRIQGRGGDDVITVDSAFTASVIATGGSGNDTITGGSGDDFLYGGDITLTSNITKPSSKLQLLPVTDGDDVLIGGAGSDRLYGGTGNDHLYGQAGADSLYGEAGNDYLDPGNDLQADYLSGGSGSDTFIQYYQTIGLRDVIADLEAIDAVFTRRV
jgi:Ca2+-binding RTX toxin-like protein